MGSLFHFLFLPLLLLTPVKTHADTRPTHLHFYMHDTFSGPNPTNIQVAKDPSNNSSDFDFGSIRIIDDPLTEGPNRSSNAVGRAQGLYTISGQSGAELLLSVNFLFTTGKYNGSTVSIFGWDRVTDSVRELSIIGGSKKFRLAKAYISMKTVYYVQDNAILEIDVYVVNSSLSSIDETQTVPSSND